MQAVGFLSDTDATHARAERLRLSHEASTFLAPHLVEMLLAKHAADRPHEIRTTIDAGLQSDIAGIIRSERPALDRAGAHNVAVVVLDNASGEWLAWEGSGDYADAAHGGTINGVLTPRQPGSALKPFTYALAFEQGYGPASVLPDVPTHFPTAETGVLYSPRNYDGRFRGPLRARLALAGSENVPAVALLSELGVPTLVRFLREAGFSTFDKTATYYGLGLTLGNAEVRLDEIVAAYAMFARGGTWIAPHAERTGDGTRDADMANGAMRLVSPRTAFWITDILSDPDARAFVFGRGGSLEFPFPVAVKTGTSQAYHDNWTIGYTREVTVGVWVGNFDREPLRSSSGVAGAGPIFHAAMLAAMSRVRGPVTIEDGPLMTPADGVTRARICALSGLRANAWCPTQTTEWVDVDAPALPCSWHHRADEGLLTIWPDPYRQWAREQGLSIDGESPRAMPRLARFDRGTSDTPASDTAVSGSRESGSIASGSIGKPAPRHRISAVEPLRIVNPPIDAIYLYDPTLRAEFQTLPLRTTGARTGDIQWLIDGRVVGRSPADAPFHWPLTIGPHTVAARDAQGRSAETRILVK
jgi:penicillin-binding protein 1C